MKLEEFEAEHIPLVTAEVVDPEDINDADDESDEETTLEEDLEESLELLSKCLDEMEKAIRYSSRRRLHWSQEKDMTELCIDVSAFLSQWDNPEKEDEGVY